MKIASLLALVAATLFVGGTSQAKERGPSAFVRVLHAISNGPKVDVFVDGKKILNDNTFDALSKYIRIPSGYHTFRIASNNPTRVLVSGSRTFTRDHFYTVGVFGRLNSPRLFAADDTATRVPNNRALLSVYHLAPGAPAVNVTGTINGTRVITLGRNLSYNRHTALAIPAVPMTIRITRTNRPVNVGVLKTVTGFKPRAGLKYTAYVIGNVSRNFKVLLDSSATQ